MWPYISKKGRQFYLGKAWWLKTRSLGIVSQYSNYFSITQYLMHIFSLSFLNTVKEGYIFYRTSNRIAFR